jgi:K+-transporting ATPase ATPase B chain
VEIGKEILITRGALTTFSIATDVAKYFAIIPAIFAVTYPQLNILNIMQLHTPESAVLSAVIFNAIIIPLLIPLALRGVKFRSTSSVSKLLALNITIYGLGGLILPFVAIKVIDILISFLGVV